MNVKNILDEAREEWYIPTEDEDDRAHLMEVMEGVSADLVVFWQAAEPLLRRDANGPLVKALSSNFLRACDGVRHSYEWLRRMPQRASDGTHVWEHLPEAAVTNEPEVRSDQVARREADPDGVSGGRQERDSVPHGASASDEVKRLQRQVRITQWKADQAQRKAAIARGRRPAPRRRKGAK